MSAAGSFRFQVSSLSVAFTDSSQNATSRLWDFGNGKTDTAQNPAHVYDSAGAYTVCLTARNYCYADSLCDTVKVTCTLSSAKNTAICSGDSIFLSGSWQSAGGSYYDTLKTAQGCDSVVTTTLAINPVYSSSASDTICVGGSAYIAGAWRKTAGTFYDSLKTAKGCDSVIATTLFVAPLPAMSIAGNDSMYCTWSFPDTLYGIPAGGVFLGTGITGNVFSPSAAGAGTHSIVYAYTDSAGCRDSATVQLVVSVCGGVIENGAPQFTVFPNPAEQKVHVSCSSPLEFTLRIYDITGRAVGNLFKGTGRAEMDIGGTESGLYFIRIESNAGAAVVKVAVRQRNY